MKHDSLNVYERPEAEELKVFVESNYLVESQIEPICPQNQCPIHEEVI